mgnify:CR=1 FL=1
MTIIKEILKYNPELDKNIVSPYQPRIIIRTNTYGSNFAHFKMLFDEVKKDFPFITPEKADIKHYGGRHYKGTYGIEFNIDSEVKVPDAYKPIHEVEYTL